MNERQSGGMGDELTNAALIALIGVFALGLVLRGAGSITAFLTRTSQPTVGPAGGMSVLFNPANPGVALGADGLNPVAYWAVTAVLLAAVTV